MQASAQSKEQCYESVDLTLSRLPPTEQTVLLIDCESWPSVLAHPGIKNMNEDGQRLLELCCFHKLCLIKYILCALPCYKPDPSQKNLQAPKDARRKALSTARRCATDYWLKLTDGRLFVLARLRAKTKIRRVLLRELLFADDAAVSSHTEECLQRLMDTFSHACKQFGLTISIKKTNVMGQNTPSPPAITVENEVLKNTNEFTYLGSTITSNRKSLHGNID
ncbi:hypothetical protein EGW08_017080 [Elysia chlorotica]|uniref:Reverse transcriptase domain-containing protein n=1 Tax=Elysia chlorotica TaxID=188477 RepID=A0A3S0ZTV9_ELYCH|nr:hypothetical protein EGW08_017080 [Elysia chlorotica]